MKLMNFFAFLSSIYSHRIIEMNWSKQPCAGLKIRLREIYSVMPPSKSEHKSFISFVLNTVNFPSENSQYWNYALKAQSDTKCTVWVTKLYGME